MIKIAGGALRGQITNSMKPSSIMDTTAGRRITGDMNSMRLGSAAGESTKDGGMWTAAVGVMSMIGMIAITITSDYQL
jgi:hypothetical protein